MANKANLLLKLSVDKDLRTIEPKELKTGRIAYFFDTVSKKFNNMLLTEIFFLIFAAPAIFIVYWAISHWKVTALADFSFASTMGIGYSLAPDSISLGIEALYGVYYKMMLFLIPAIAFMGIGAAGLFYCSRGFMWDEPVIVYKAFFRGIKKHWAKYLPVFAVLGVIAAAVGIGLLSFFKAQELNNADFISYLVLIVSILGGLLTLMVIIYLLPMFSCYKFKFKEYLKNSVVLDILLIPATLTVAIISALPFVIGSINIYINTIILIALVGIGFVFIAMMWTTYAQGVFDNMIKGMYSARIESERKRLEKPRKSDKTEFSNPKKKQGGKSGKGK